VVRLGEASTIGSPVLFLPLVTPNQLALPRENTPFANTSAEVEVVRAVLGTFLGTFLAVALRLPCFALLVLAISMLFSLQEWW
jgi:hypothetical protein